MPCFKLILVLSNGMIFNFLKDLRNVFKGATKNDTSEDNF